MFKLNHRRKIKKKAKHLAQTEQADSSTNPQPTDALLKQVASNEKNLQNLAASTRNLDTALAHKTMNENPALIKDVSDRVTNADLTKEEISKLPIAEQRAYYDNLYGSKGRLLRRVPISQLAEEAKRTVASNIEHIKNANKFDNPLTHKSNMSQSVRFQGDSARMVADADYDLDAADESVAPPSNDHSARKAKRTTLSNNKQLADAKLTKKNIILPSRLKKMHSADKDQQTILQQKTLAALKEQGQMKKQNDKLWNATKDARKHFMDNFKFKSEDE